jgi:hypothetical protein
MAKFSQDNKNRDDGFYESMPASMTGSTGIRSTARADYDAIVESSTASAIVFYLAVAVEVILGFRLVLRLFSWGAGNSVANAILALSKPLMWPFTTLFNMSNINYSVGTFEWVTVFAMLVYGLIAYAILAIMRSYRSSM